VSNFKSLLVILFGAAVASAACNVERSSHDEVEDTKLQARLEQGHPALAYLPQVDRLALNSNSQTTFVSGQLGFELEAVGQAFEMGESALTLKQSDRDSLGFTIERYSQARNGLEVIGGDLRVARQEDSSIHSVSGLAWDLKQETMEAQLSAEQALDIAMGRTEGITEASESRIVYVAPSTGGSPVLAWHFVLEGNRDGMPVVDDVYVNAERGGVVARHPRIHTARNRQTYDAGNQDLELGNLIRVEGDLPTGDIDVDQAHDSAGVTYDCLSELFSRDSFDGLGTDLISVANFGVQLENAFWDGTNSIMVYGDGMGVADVGTHEFVHAVTQYTGGMVYENESGALNEAWSDILSAACDAKGRGAITDATWTLGEDSALGVIRYMSNPTLDGVSSDHYDTRYIGEEDAGGVHLNSGIANLAFYLLTEGGRHPRATTNVLVGSIGIENAGQIFYRALASYMNTNTDFLGARVATEQAAADLFGPGSDETISVSEAWSAVGVGGPAPERQEEPTPEDPIDPTEPGDGSGTGDNGAGTGTVVGGCSTSGSQGSNGLGLILLLGFVGVIRRRR
jgi:MYXO-CTERM domain-containing protein